MPFPDPGRRVFVAAVEEARSVAELSAHDFCSTFESSSLAVLVLGVDGLIWARNRRALELGIDASGFELPVAREAKDFARALSAASRGQTGSMWLSQVPGGQSGEFFVELMPWPGAKGAVVAVVRAEAHIGVSREVSERRTRFESLGRLASTVAHDFNNLLTGIRGSLAMIRNGASEQSRTRALNSAEAATQRAGEMIRQLLAFGRGTLVETDTARVDLVLNETVQLINCMGGGVQVCLMVDADVERVDMLPSHLHQVVLNLLMNATDAVRDAGPEGRVVVHALRCSRSTIAGVSPSRRWVQITISDNGLGIALSLRRRIFEPFFSTKTDRSGTGLGLSSVKALVERVGGWVEVESEERAGTSFHVFLPLAAEGLMVLGATEAETPIRVLICDDESRLADLTAGLLEEFGYRATSVAQGAAALDVLTHKPRAQLLILDVNLSAGLSAAAVLRGMLDASVNIPVILTSGLAPEEVPLELREHPLVVSYLGKPYTVEELTSGIEQALKSPRVPSDWSPGVLT